MTGLFMNPGARPLPECPPPSREPLRFHERLPGYAPTPLYRSARLARDAGVGELLVKHEGDRFGLPAFKVLGASWAVYCLVRVRFGIRDREWTTVEELGERLNIRGLLSLVTATDGNHGRGVARVARWLGFSCRVFVPEGTAAARIEAIRSEGAGVEVVPGGYDRAVETAADHDGPVDWLIQDTGWEGYRRIPELIAEGYSTMLHEIEDQLRDLRDRDPGMTEAVHHLGQPDLVMVPIGVGSLAEAAVRHFRHGGRAGTAGGGTDGTPEDVGGVGGGTPLIIGVEPEGVACGMESMRTGRPVTIREPGETIMAGLNCGTLSATAWPFVRDGIDAFVTVGDDRAVEAVRLLHREGIPAGESGASGLAGLLELRHHPQVGKLLQSRGVRGGLAGASVLILATEGVTDPELYGRIVRG